MPYWFLVATTVRTSNKQENATFMVKASWVFLSSAEVCLQIHSLTMFCIRVNSHLYSVSLILPLGVSQSCRLERLALFWLRKDHTVLVEGIHALT